MLLEPCDGPCKLSIASVKVAGMKYWYIVLPTYILISLLVFISACLLSMSDVDIQGAVMASRRYKEELDHTGVAFVFVKFMLPVRFVTTMISSIVVVKRLRGAGYIS